MTRRRLLALIAVGSAGLLVVTAAIVTGVVLAPVVAEQQRVYPASGNTPPPPPDPIEQYAADRLSVMTLEQKIASMLMVHAPGLDPAAWAATAGSGVGGMILMGDNVPAPEEDLATYTTIGTPEAGLPVLYAIDQEGGIVRRIFADEWASAYDLRFQDPSAARAAFNDRGTMLQSLGVDINFGIVADVTADPSSFIYERTLGDDAGASAARVAEAVAGESGTVLSTLKHFPGHGVSPGDSHNEHPGDRDGTRRVAGEPCAAVRGGDRSRASGSSCSVTCGSTRSTRCRRRCPLMWHQVLRDELGFDGLIVTDDMAMLQNSGEPAYADQLTNAIAAVNAGNTMLALRRTGGCAGHGRRHRRGRARWPYRRGHDRRRCPPAARGPPHDLRGDRTVLGLLGAVPGDGRLARFSRRPQAARGTPHIAGALARRRRQPWRSAP